LRESNLKERETRREVPPKRGKTSFSTKKRAPTEKKSELTDALTRATKYSNHFDGGKFHIKNPGYFLLPIPIGTLFHRIFLLSDFKNQATS
jgi:hypothetical protein